MTVHHRLDHGQTQPQAVAAVSRGKTPILTEQLGKFIDSNPSALIG